MRVLRSISLRILLVAGLCTVLGIGLLAFSSSRLPESDQVLGAIVVLMIVLGAAMLLSYYLIARPLSRRIHYLATIAHKVGKAEFEIAPDPTRDEMGDVSRALREAHRRALDHERLLSAQYQALRSKQVNIAHDLRTPLTTLLLALESARDAALSGDEDPIDSIRAAMSDGLYMTSLVQNLRIASRMDAGFATLGARRTLDLIDIVQRVRARFQLLTRGSKTEIDVAHPDEPVLVEGDETMIEQMITNLVQNSLSYGGDEQQIVINLDQEDDRFAIEVLDEGPGIDPGAMTEITNRFVRGEEGGRRKSGQGLGLAIVAEVATVHGWKLELSNRAEGGLRAKIMGTVVPPFEESERAAAAR